MKSTNLANACHVYPQIAQLKARVHPQIWPQLLLPQISHSLLTVNVTFQAIQGEHKVFPWLQTLQENYVEYKHNFFTINLVSKILCHLFIVTFVTLGFWMQHFQTGGLGEMVRHPGHYDRRISPPLISFHGGMLRIKCFRHQFQILLIWRQE